MKKIYFEDLQNVIENEMLGSESILCDCLYNNHFFIYKQPNSLDTYMTDKLIKLANINNDNILTPNFIVYSKTEQPIGYLLNYLKNYKSLYYLDMPKKDKIKVLRKVKKAIISMHSDKIIHCDLHTANIMYGNNTVKIIDLDSSKYLNYNTDHFNIYSKQYLEKNKLTKSIDIFNFNIDTFSFLYNISWDDVFKYDYTIKLTDKQNEIWQKTKERKELTYNDFLIDHY